ncbi:hypothetical protein OAA38_00590 [bacterium]|nr:hypothetical protein [bacterium]
MKNVTVSYGEYLDRYTILCVKKSKGLDVEIELNDYDLSDLKINEYFVNILNSIHSQLWEIEDKKRTDSERYTVEYSDLSTLTCQLNDLRHKVKREIDLFYGSEFTEQKSHEM